VKPALEDLHVRLKDVVRKVMKAEKTYHAALEKRLSENENALGEPV
jgi:hypothetical protein